MVKKFHIFAIAALGKGLSGGDRIFIELAKRISRAHSVVVHVWREGYEICKTQDLKDGVEFNVINVSPWCNFGFLICYFTRVVKAIWYALFAKIDNGKDTIVYSASEFWMDSLPAFILKLRFPKIVWVACWFQTAPNPLLGFTQGNRQSAYRSSALYYWLMQLPIKPIIKRYADLILVNNEEERKQFPDVDQQKRVIVMLGAVNFSKIQSWSKVHRLSKDKEFDAVFQGRFHPQKGVVELIEIWKLVTDKLPQAKLAMIGDGPLKKDVEKKIKVMGLNDNVKLFGYVFDGPEKYSIFAKSKIAVHPSFYDSGGMAAAEAMAFGLPCVGFDLEAYKSYYPKGMIKADIGDFEQFALRIEELIAKTELRNRIGREAQKTVKENWSWDQRASLLMNNIDNIVVK